MLGSQHLLPYLEYSLVELFGGLVLPLVPIQASQLIHCRSGIGMLDSQRLLLYLERALVERFHLGITTTMVEVPTESMKQIGFICEGEVILVNEGGTMEAMREIRFIRGEIPIIHLRGRFPERM